MTYTGLIAELPLGSEGLTGTKNLSQVRPQQLIEALNLTFENGTLQKEGGAEKYNSSAISGTPEVIGGWDWYPSSGVQRMVVVTSDGDILKDSGGGTFGTTLKSGLTVSSQVPVFADGGKEAAANDRKLFVATGANVVQVLSADGATTSDITSPPTDWSGANQPTFIFLSEGGRMMGGGNLNDPHRLYYSTTSDHENVSGGGTLAVYPGEGEGLAAGISFKGLTVLFKKPRGIYLADMSNSDTSAWRVTPLTRSIGIAGPRAWTFVDDDVIFMDEAGNIHLLSAVTEFGDMGSRNLSQVADLGPFIRDNINLSQLGLARMIYYSAKRQAHIALAGTGSTENNVRLVVDFNRLDLPRFHYSDRDTCQDIWLRKDDSGIPRPVSGDDAGFVWLMDQDSRSKDGSGYAGQFQTPHDDLSALDPKFATIMKNFDFLELVVDPKGNWDLSVDVQHDGAVHETVTFNMGSAGAALGTFELGTDRLASSQVLNRKKRITGQARRISLVGKNSGDSQDFSVAKFYLHFRPSDERIS